MLTEDSVALTALTHHSFGRKPAKLGKIVDDGRIKNGDVLAMEAIGGGLVWGAALVKFGRPS